MSETKASLRQHIAALLPQVEQPAPVLRRLSVERVGSDMRVACWCGKARLLSVEHINVFCKQLNDFLYSHAACEPMTGGNDAA